MKNLLKAFGIIALVAVIGFSMAACDNGGGDDPNPNPNPNPNPDPVILTMQFTENTGWNQTGNEEWCRWHYKYQGANTGTLDSNKAYILTCSFTSNVDIDELNVQFIKETDWVQVSDVTSIHIPGDIPKNTRYNFSVPLFPNSNASDFLYVMIGNRNNNANNNTAPVLSFYQFSLEPVNKETAGLTKWTVSGKDITVTDTRRTFAENLSSYQGKSNVFHIKPTYNASTYDWLILEYDLSAYSGKKIGVEMSLDAWINKEARVAWQMLIAPDYQVVCGYTESTYFLSANTWHTISGNTIVSVPSNGGKLYLSPMQINGAEAYFANATLTITDGTGVTDTAVTLNSVTADGSASSKTTQLTLTFSQAITGLNAANINLGSSISGLTKGTLSGSGPTYTLPVTGFTTGGSLSVSVTKLGYNISGGTKTVTIYGGSGSGSGGGGGGGGQNDPGDLAGTWTGNIGGYNAIVTVSGSGWTMTASNANFYDSGYFVRNGNTATLYLSSGTSNGTATLINSTTIQVVLNSNTIFPGTYTLTKQGSSIPSVPLTWTAVGDSKFGSSGIYAIAYSGSRFVAGGADGKMAYSTDGITWNAVANSTFGTTAIQTIAYGGSKFVAGGNNGKIAYSTDGITWQAVGDSKLGTAIIRTIMYGDSGFIAGGDSKIAFSSDGITWYAGGDSTFGTSVIYGIAGKGSAYVAVGQWGKMAYANNALSWTAVNDNKFSASSGMINGIASNNIRFVAVGEGVQTAYSTNGTTWTAGATPASGILQGITFCNNKFITWVYHNFYTSTDGLTWTDAGESGYSTTHIEDVAGDGNKFVAVLINGKIVYSSGN